MYDYVWRQHTMIAVYLKENKIFFYILLYQYLLILLEPFLFPMLCRKRNCEDGNKYWVHDNWKFVSYNLQMYKWWFLNRMLCIKQIHLQFPIFYAVFACSTWHIEYNYLMLLSPIESLSHHHPWHYNTG